MRKHQTSYTYSLKHKEGTQYIQNHGTAVASQYKKAKESLQYREQKHSLAVVQLNQMTDIFSLC